MRRALRSGRHPPAFKPFFVAALVFAGLAVPVCLAGWRGGDWACPGCGAPFWHPHEMLFGFALAVVGGFLFTRISHGALAIALAAWLAGRVAAAAGLPASPWTAAAALAYPACVLVFAALPFLRAARSAHNVVFAPILATFLAAELLFQLGELGLLAEGQRRGVLLALGLFALLLIVMGGRIIPAATAGAIRDKGGHLPFRVQPVPEWTAIAAAAVAALLDTLMAAPAVAGAASALAGAATLARLARWRPLAVRDRPALWSLHLGYAWLGIGLLLKGAAQAGAPLPLAAAVHAVTIGGLGTLTLAMMIRTWQQRTGRAVAFAAPATAAVAAVSLSAALRLAAGLEGDGPLLDAAGWLWTAACGLALAALALPSPPHPER